MEFYQKMLLILGIVVVGVLAIFAISSLQDHKSSQLSNNQTQNQQINLQWNTDLTFGLKLAEKSNKLVLLIFILIGVATASSLMRTHLLTKKLRRGLLRDMFLSK